MVVIEGPRFSTRAESNIYRSWGGSVITMTPVPEVILAKEAGLCYASIALVTDYDCWRDSGKKVCVQEVVMTFKANVEKVKTLIISSIAQVASKEWDETIKDLQVRFFSLNNLFIPKILYFGLVFTFVPMIIFQFRKMANPI